MIKDFLHSNSDQKYKEFTTKLVPNVDKSRFIGVRIPILRKYAIKLSKNEEILQQLNTLQTNCLLGVKPYVEEVILFGFLINYSKLSITKKFELYNTLMPYLSSWYETDSIFQGVKDFSYVKNKNEVFNFATSLLQTESEFANRSAVVILLRYFLDSEYIDKTIQVLSNIRSEKYYVYMAISWAFCEILSADFIKGFNAIKTQKLQENIVKNTVKKANESYKISKENKQLLNEYIANM